MGVPKYERFSVDFNEWFPQGLYLVGKIAPVTEYQSQEDRRATVRSSLGWTR